jgi:predicted  nucleic acid-binding Zn-ribbon protein
MSFSGLQLRFVRFLGPKKPPAEFTFTSGLNVLWGASDTGKSFLVETIDFMLGGGEALKDIPERNGYERVLLGISTAAGKTYTLQRSINGGNFLRFDGLVKDPPVSSKSAIKLNAKHSTKNANNISRFLLQEIGLDNKTILYSKESGETRALGFRALAHLCVITAQEISKSISPIESGQYLDRMREYGVFKLLLTGIDDSSIVPEVEEPSLPIVVSPTFRADVLEPMLAAYEDELAELTDSPETLEEQDRRLAESAGQLQQSLRDMETRLEEATRRRKEVWGRYSSLTSRRDEIDELEARFSLLDEHYTTDLKRLQAIEESGQFFVLLPVAPCPLCGANPENQLHTAVCDGNVSAIVQAAYAEIGKIELLQRELRDTVGNLLNERARIVQERDTLELQLRSLQQQIDAAVSPEFAETRTAYSQLVEKRSEVRQALNVYRRVLDTRAKLLQVPEGMHKGEPEDEATSVTQYLSKTALDEFANGVERLLQAWHYPNATNVYFDETKRDLVIGSKPRGSRGRGSCAITHSAFTIGLLDFCRQKNLAHPGFIVLDSPLLAYKEPQADDENIVAGTDLKVRFYEHLITFLESEQLFIVENTEPTPGVLDNVHHEVFTGNPNIDRYGLFPPITK